MLFRKSGHLLTIATLASGIAGFALLSSAQMASAKSAEKADKSGRTAQTKKEKEFKQPLLISVSLGSQRLTAYRGEQSVARFSISSGKRGHATPTGIFTVLQKRRRHFSNLYNGAPMPYMQRLTWSGIALHQGNVPGYPASHGCVRLPGGRAKALFSMTRTGLTHTIIARNNVVPKQIRHTGLPFPMMPKKQHDDGQRSAKLRLSGTQLAAIGNPAFALPLRPVSAKKQGKTKSYADYWRLSLSFIKPTDDPKDWVAVWRRPDQTENPLRLYISRTTRTERIRLAQDMMKQLQYYLDVSDGLMGKGTIRAVKRFQRAEGLRATGTLTRSTMDRLHEITHRPRLAAGKLYLRQGFKTVLEAPVGIVDPHKPLGAHLFLLIDANRYAQSADWIVASVPQRIPDSIRNVHQIDVKRGSYVSTDPAKILDRLVINNKVRDFINLALTSGSSLAVSDNGLGNETGKGTDFVVRTY